MSGSFFLAAYSASRVIFSHSAAHAAHDEPAVHDSQGGTVAADPGSAGNDRFPQAGLLLQGREFLGIAGEVQRVPGAHIAEQLPEAALIHGGSQPVPDAQYAMGAAVRADPQQFPVLPGKNRLPTGRAFGIQVIGD